MRSDLASLLPVRVAARYLLAEGVVGFDLVAVDGMPLPAYEPGAHIDVHTPGGAVRPYSLCHPHEVGQPYRIAVLLEATGRGGSASMHADVATGAVLKIGLPRNLFALNEHAPHTVLLAGGIGITPLLAMAERLHALRQPYVLHYATRNRASAAFADALRSGRLPAHAHLHHDDEAGGLLDIPRILRAAPPGSHLYVCGPGGFVQAVRDAAQALAWPEAQVHVEAFSAPLKPASQTAAATASGDASSHASSSEAGAFEVALSRTGGIVTVRPHQTIVDALAAHGLRVPVSCEQGLCGTCETRVLDGQVDHRDFHYSAAEQARHDRMLICCSRSHGPRLVLDL